jgi:hypothetical protein
LLAAVVAGDAQLRRCLVQISGNVVSHRAVVRVGDRPQQRGPLACGAIATTVSSYAGDEASTAACAIAAPPFRPGSNTTATREQNRSSTGSPATLVPITISMPGINR